MPYTSYLEIIVQDDFKHKCQECNWPIWKWHVYVCLLSWLQSIICKMPLSLSLPIVPSSLFTILFDVAIFFIGASKEKSSNFLDKSWNGFDFCFIIYILGFVYLWLQELTKVSHESISFWEYKSVNYSNISWCMIGL